MLSDDEILERGGTETDIENYAHDVGYACMYPEFDCDICKEREKYDGSSSYPPNQDKREEEWEKEFDKICECKWYYGKPTGWILDDEDAGMLKGFIRNLLHSHTEAVRREERERILKTLDWRNRTDKTTFNDGDDVIDWIDGKLQALQEEADSGKITP